MTTEQGARPDTRNAERLQGFVPPARSTEIGTERLHYDAAEPLVCLTHPDLTGIELARVIEFMYRSDITATISEFVQVVTARERDGANPYAVGQAQEDAEYEAVETVLVAQWHLDQCGCRDFDGVDMSTCVTHLESDCPSYPPNTWATDAVLAARRQVRADLKEQTR